MLDKFGRTINTIRVSVTDKCNLGCVYCKPKGEMVNSKVDRILSLEEIHDIVREAASLGITCVKLTGGEPLMRKNITHLIRSIASIEGIRDISMTTNGTLLPLYAGEIKKAGLQRVNISLDSLDKEKYNTITGGNLDDVLAGIKAAQAAGFTPIKINTVYMPRLNRNEIETIRDFCKQHNLWHQLINQMNINKEKKMFEDFCTTDKPPRCELCSRIRLTCRGTLLPCLFSTGEIAVSDFSSIREALVYTIIHKPEIGRYNRDGKMYQIGG